MMRLRHSVSIMIALVSVLYGGVTSILKRSPGTKFILYTGTSDAAKSKGISAFRFEAADATTEPLGVVAEMANPLFMAVHPQNRLLYAVSGVKDGMLSGYAINPKSGALRLIATVPSLGEEPCHVMVDYNGWMIVVTNCGSGSVVSYRVGGDGGILESPSQITNSDPKLKPHPHQMVMSPDHFFLFGPDLGMNKIFFYRFDPARVIFWPNAPASVSMKPGFGPRNLVFRPDGRFGYAADQTASRISTMRYDKLTGTVAAVDDISTLPDGFSGKNSAMNVEVDAAGKFLYVSNQGDDSIVVFSVAAKTGALTKVQRISTGGKAAGFFKIDPTGQYLLAANQDSGTITILRIDRKTGMLGATGKVLETPALACLVFVPAE